MRLSDKVRRIKSFLAQTRSLHQMKFSSSKIGDTAREHAGWAFVKNLVTVHPILENVLINQVPETILVYINCIKQGLDPRHIVKPVLPVGNKENKRIREMASHFPNHPVRIKRLLHNPQSVKISGSIGIQIIADINHPVSRNTPSCPIRRWWLDHQIGATPRDCRSKS